MAYTKSTLVDHDAWLCVFRRELCIATVVSISVLYKVKYVSLE